MNDFSPPKTEIDYSYIILKNINNINSTYFSFLIDFSTMFGVFNTIKRL